MTALFAYRRQRPIHAFANPFARVAILLAAMAAVPAHGADTLTVALDQATITKLPERVGTIVIGNPLIADVSIQSGGLLVITGKGYGTTNLIALDRDGAILTERNIEVVSPKDNIVVVYRGVNRESYSCTPECQGRITLGDNPDFFGQVIGQSSDRTAHAQSQGASAAPGGGGSR
jgi:Flp pilus assembly secretin CpaC